MSQLATETASQPNKTQFGHMNAARQIPFRFFAFFLISGCCSLLYEVVWLRLAMAQFGVTITMTSTVISVFMAGLGLGSWASGKLTSRLEMRRQFPRVWAYALIELVIGISSLVVPYEFLLGRTLLEAAGFSSSLGYYVIAGLWLAGAMLPWCICMGATFPIAMWAIREYSSDGRGRSFSFLYVANVLGAFCGTLLPLALIEHFGFRNTLLFGGMLNFLLAACAFGFGVRDRKKLSSPGEIRSDIPLSSEPTGNSSFYLFLLFATGLASMGMEVVWIRLFTPYLGTAVYAFAVILGGYLASTALGSLWYRRMKLNAWRFSIAFWTTLGLAACLPFRAANPAWRIAQYAFDDPGMGVIRVALGITCFTLWLGFLTPMLVDRISGGDPDKAGKAYAINVIGCIVGPLLAGFILLPIAGERWTLGILVAMCFVAGGWFAFGHGEETISRPSVWRTAFVASAVVAFLILAKTRSFDGQFKTKMVVRDSTATVTATGQGRGKRLLVNGVGMTALTPVTKFMAHLPLALLNRPPERALDICFGMGTTFRSLLTWGIHTDAAELVPSVPAVFPYFHPDAPQVLKSALGRVIVDDGRRYLERTDATYDLITIDPPPPLTSAGSSLLYSKEFYAIAKRKLKPGGILAQWLPGENAEIRVAVTRAIQQSFAYVRVFGPIEDRGIHLLASDSPIPQRSAHELAERLPAAASADLVEWGPYSSAEAQFAAVLQKEISPDSLISKAPGVSAMVDDRPINEYYILRTRGRRLPGAHFY